MNGCDYSISRGFSTVHNGVDMVVREGCIVHSIAPGVVEHARWGNGGQGYYVSVKHTNGYYSNYLHGNGTFFVKEGDQVNAGTPIMSSGNTGNSTGPHLHLEIWEGLPWKFGYPNSTGSLDPALFFDY